MVFWLDVPQASLNNYITQWSQHIFHRKVCVFRVALWKALWGRPRVWVQFSRHFTMQRWWASLWSGSAFAGHFRPVVAPFVTVSPCWNQLSPWWLGPGGKFVECRCARAALPGAVWLETCLETFHPLGEIAIHIFHSLWGFLWTTLRSFCHMLVTPHFFLLTSVWRHNDGQDWGIPKMPFLKGMGSLLQRVLYFRVVKNYTSSRYHPVNWPNHVKPPSQWQHQL